MIFVVPTIPSGNIHAPVVMLAEKGADLVKELWLQEEVIRTEREAVASEKAKREAFDSAKVNAYANATAA